MKWLKRKSAEHQLRNTLYRVRRLVAAADVMTAAWDAGKEPSQEAASELQAQKNKLVSDMVGLVGVDQLRRMVIEPELLAIQAHKDACSAVLSVCEWMAKQTSDDATTPTFSDQEIAAIGSVCRRGLVARFLKVSE